MMHSANWRYLFLAGIVILLLAAVALVPLKSARVKMLPFDNTSEFQVVVDMPNGTTLEQTARVSQALGQYLGQQVEVANYQVYAGLSGPYNFNGLVRHYYLRSQPNQADIQVNLLPPDRRSAQSHEIAKRMRPELQKIGLPFGARIKVRSIRFVGLNLLQSGFTNWCPAMMILRALGLKNAASNSAGGRSHA